MALESVSYVIESNSVYIKFNFIKVGKRLRALSRSPSSHSIHSRIRFDIA